MKGLLFMLMLSVCCNVFGQSRWTMHLGNGFGKAIAEEESLIKINGLFQVYLLTMYSMYNEPSFAIQGGVFMSAEGFSINDFHIVFPEDNNFGTVDIYNSSVNHNVTQYTAGTAARLTFGGEKKKYRGQLEVRYGYELAENVYQSITESGFEKSTDQRLQGYNVERNPHTLEVYHRSGFEMLKIGKAKIIIGGSIGMHLLRELDKSERTGEVVKGQGAYLGIYTEVNI